MYICSVKHKDIRHASYRGQGQIPRSRSTAKVGCQGHLPGEQLYLGFENLDPFLQLVYEIVQLC